MKKIVRLIAIATLWLTACKSDKQKLVEIINAGEEKMFNDKSSKFSDSAATSVLKHYLAFADAYKDDTLSGEYIFRAAELENSLHSYKEAVDLYERLITSYPGHPKVAAALFMQAFVFDTGLHNPEKAKTKYKEFLDKYPGHQLAASAKATYDQLNAGISDEDLVKIFEARQDSISKLAN